MSFFPRRFALIPLALLFVVAASTVMPAQSAKPSSSSAVNFDSLPDAPDAFAHAMEQLLLDRRFDQLDQIADHVRSTKKRWPGGRWVLPTFYLGVSTAAYEAHATEQDWVEHMKAVQDWAAAKPSSITARVALAQSWTDYAWFARGDKTGDTVTENGWNAFSDRLAKAKQVLDQAAKLDAKCPHWYRAMMTVALGQSWPLERQNALYKQAIAFEPGYYVYYRAMGRYLLPQWNGEEGDIARFAASAADSIGGDAGDIVYFEVASELTCDCNVSTSPVRTMDWNRLQRGFQAARSHFGASNIQLNQVALMSIIFADAVAADEYFHLIGDNRDNGIWDKSYFDANKQWAAEMGPWIKSERDGLKAARENMKTEPGRSFLAEFQQKVGPAWQGCVTGAEGKLEAFQLTMRLAADGNIMQVNGVGNNSRALASCVLKALARRDPFTTKPPKADYWLVFDLDPARDISAAPAASTAAASTTSTN